MLGYFSPDLDPGTRRPGYVLVGLREARRCAGLSPGIYVVALADGAALPLQDPVPATAPSAAPPAAPPAAHGGRTVLEPDTAAHLLAKIPMSAFQDLSPILYAHWTTRRKGRAGGDGGAGAASHGAADGGSAAVPFWARAPPSHRRGERDSRVSSVLPGRGLLLSRDEAATQQKRFARTRPQRKARAAGGGVGDAAAAAARRMTAEAQQHAVTAEALQAQHMLVSGLLKVIQGQLARRTPWLEIEAVVRERAEQGDPGAARVRELRLADGTVRLELPNPRCPAAEAQRVGRAGRARTAESGACGGGPGAAGPDDVEEPAEEARAAAPGDGRHARGPLCAADAPGRPGR